MSLHTYTPRSEVKASSNIWTSFRLCLIFEEYVQLGVNIPGTSMEPGTQQVVGLGLGKIMCSDIYTSVFGWACVQAGIYYRRTETHTDICKTNTGLFEYTLCVQQSPRGILALHLVCVCVCVCVCACVRAYVRVCVCVLLLFVCSGQLWLIVWH